MSDLDHMLNGRGSRQQIEYLIRQAQHYMLVREIEAAQGKHKAGSSLRAILSTVIHIFRR